MKEYIVKTVEVIGYIMFILALFGAATGMIVSTFSFDLGMMILLFAILLIIAASLPCNIRNL